MSRSLRIVLTVAALAAAPLALTACHATAGAGQDVAATGNALTNSANSNTPH